MVGGRGNKLNEIPRGALCPPRPTHTPPERYFKRLKF